MQKVIINPSYGGINSGIVQGSFIEKNYNLELAKSIQNKLNNLGINTYLVRNDDSTLTTQDRLNIINSYINTNDEVIVLTLQIIESDENGAEIIYSLRDIDTLSRDITDNLESIGLSVLKFYQLRNPNNTSTDFYELIREPNTSENIIISLGNPSNSAIESFIVNNIDKIA